MITKDTAYQNITQLVERFDEQKESYKKSDYNETLVRRDFIDPFFKSLGWDIDNSQGYAEAYREVIHEDRVKIGSATKAPDYSFRLPGGKRLFFVEAKKPSVLVKNEIMPAYQVRRYAWSAKLPVSILTDFEEFAVYDCNKKPKPDDKASTGRIKYLTYSDYLKEFDFIWDTFSKERVLKGSFDKFVASDVGKKGTTTVDKDFLASLDEWRIQLAQNIALRNPLFNEDELNYAVQQTIDRIIFLRIAEDRGVEEYGRLKTTLKGENYYTNLFHLFKEADEKYNSGLFDFKKDKLSASLQLDNKVLKGIFNELYYPVSPYEFSVLSVEILGSAYEQFLGKQIKLTDKHKASIEEKPEVRKAGGVYYTPQYIVDYIVQQTVGRRIEELSKQFESSKASPVGGGLVGAVAKLKIVDPACGSGSFLIGAYQHLLTWYQDFYKPKFDELSAIAGSNDYTNKQRNDAIKERNKLPLTPDGALTSALKKQILLNNIYGVDIDTQAVEVTKLSLLLKCMEGETQSSINAEMRFGERILPTLDSNIKSGNSLIDLDFYDGEFDFDAGAEKKIKPFNWEKAFTEVFKNGGFDAVIGNPPWGAGFLDVSVEYIRKKYVSAAKGTFDSYALFVEKALRVLKTKGLLGFITPDTFLRKDDFVSFRALIFDNYQVNELIETGPMFSKVRDTWCCIINIENIQSNKSSIVAHKKLSRFIVSVEERLSNFGNQKWDVSTFVPQTVWQGRSFKIIGYKASEHEQQIICKIETNPTLQSLKDYRISRGEEGSKFNIVESENGDFFMVIPEDVEKYFVSTGKRIKSESLTPNKVQSIYSHPKIWIIRIQKMRWIQRIVSAIDLRRNTAGMKTLQSIVSNTDNLDDLFYLQAILASKLINFWCVNYLADDINQSYLEKIPIKNSTTKERNEIIKTVQLLMDLHKEKQQTTLPEKLESLQHRINHTDDKINQLVYQLYGLTEEEIKIVENS